MRKQKTAMDLDRSKLLVCEMFYSIAGETTAAGRPALFIRLSGCNLRCSWCDTQRSWEGGQLCRVGDLVGIVAQHESDLVIITGGEPLLQKETGALCRALLILKREVMVETNGSVDISAVPRPARVIMDLKAPSSGESAQMDLNNIERLVRGDEIKIVIAQRSDFDWAVQLLQEHPPPDGVNILYSPAFELLESGTLADWILTHRPRGRIQVQLQRLLWPDGRDGQAIGLPQVKVKSLTYGNFDSKTGD